MPKLCDFETCRLRATYGITSDPIRCYRHKTEHMKLSDRLCKKCSKQANYNFKGLKANFCVSCKEDNMIDVKNPKCLCGKSQPTYNFEGLNANFCINCKSESMIDLRHKKCKCGKTRPSCNFEGLKPEYCSECKLEGMQNVEKKRCKCNKSIAGYNYQGLKPEYCKLCMNKDMIDVVHEKCICKKARPTFNLTGLKPKYCISCKTNDMINVRDEKCNCGNHVPSFNFEGLKPEYCSKCKLEGMKNVKNKMCKCGKVYPTFNFEGLHQEYCTSCKLEGMINVKDERCKSDNCETRGNKNYKGYCTNCYQHLFPLDPLTFQIRSKTKEIAVRDFINSKFEGFYHDKPLWYNEATCDCTTKRRIDHRKLINGTLLCIETDENQHKNYSKAYEEARYHDLFMAYGGKFVFIRFNPDKYKDESGKSCNPMLFNRLILLEEEIQKQVKRIENDDNKDLLEVIELYYDKK
jgi:hypothetical protein